MNVYVFGNRDLDFDNIAIKIAEGLIGKIENIEFIFMDSADDFSPTEDFPIILDVAKGIDKVSIIEDIKNIGSSPLVGMHDFDLAFTLKFLIKLKKIHGFKIIAIPMEIENLENWKIEVMRFLAIQK